MTKGKGQALGSIFGAASRRGAPPATPVPAAAPSLPPNVTAFLAVVDRVESVLDAEIEALTRNIPADITDLGNRKRQGLLEMSRALKATAAGGPKLARALELDPDILSRHDTGGYNLQLMASTHYAEVCVEMARIAAHSGDHDTAIDWLTKASERGLDVRAAVKGDPLLEAYLDDERVRTALANSVQRQPRDIAPRPASLRLTSNAPAR